jgi:hypothetical protein
LWTFCRGILVQHLGHVADATGHLTDVGAEQVDDVRRVLEQVANRRRVQALDVIALQERLQDDLPIGLQLEGLAAVNEAVGMPSD